MTFHAGTARGPGHLNRLSHAAGGSAPVSAIASLTVVGSATPLDQTNDYGDATVRTGINGDGWVAKVVMPFLVASAFDPTKISLTLSDPGFDATGTVTRTRTVRGGKILRRQFTPGGAQASNQEANDGATDTVFFSLIGDNAEFATVYQGTTITAASAAAGYYGIAASGAVSGIANASTRPYYKPGFAWLNRQHEVAGAGGQYVEAVAMHKHALGGQQVARIEFTAADAHANTAATQTVSAPILSTLCTKGQPPEVYAATIPVTALTQADLCIVDAKVYPFLGDASAVLTLSTDGLNPTGTYATANPQTPLRFLNDKAGTYGVAHAAVKAGAGTGTVQATRALAETTPFATLALALAALPAYNAANGGHTGHDGSHVWLMDDGAGGAVAHTVSGNYLVTTNRTALTEIRQSPSNTAVASLLFGSASVAVAWGYSWHVDIAQDAGGHFFSGAATNDSILSYYNDGTWTQVNVNNPITFEQLAGVRNLTHAGPGMLDLGGSGTVRQEVALWLGYVATATPASAKQCRVRAVIGGQFANVHLTEFDPTVLVLHDSQDGKIVVNNQFLSNTAASGLGSLYAMTRGLFIGQNVIERASAAGVQALSIADLGSDQALDNVVVTGNTIAGDRFNLMYTNTSTKLKRAQTRFNLLDQRNTKADVYTTDATTTGRNGSFAYINGLDNWDVSLDGDSNHVGVPALGAWLGEYWANPAMARVTRAAVTYTADNSEQGANTGGGTYSLTGSTNAAYGTVPSGFAAFKYDIAGVARKNDGTGASGAYERTV